jgi:hypothetical protein
MGVDQKPKQVIAKDFSAHILQPARAAQTGPSSHPPLGWIHQAAALLGTRMPEASDNRAMQLPAANTRSPASLSTPGQENMTTLPGGGGDWQAGDVPDLGGSGSGDTPAAALQARSGCENDLSPTSI